MRLSNFLSPILLCFAGIGSRPATSEDLWLKVGEARIIPAGERESVRAGSRGIIKVIDGESMLRVVGLKPGVTSLVIGRRVFRVRVNTPNQNAFAQSLASEIHRMMGLRVDVDSVIPSIRGTLLRFSDWQKISNLARENHGDYSFEAQALPDVAEKALRYLTGVASEKGIPVIKFRAQPDFIALVPKDANGLLSRAQAIFKPYGIRVEVSDSDLMVRPLIRTKVILAELDKTESREIGVEWPSEYAGKVLPRFGLDNDIMITLKALEERGKAQILASPNLICRSGGEAKFHAGGEFPIRMFSHYSHDVIWKEHGVLLSMKPQADFQGAISLEIETEVSTLDMANAVEGIPALKSNTVQSHFDLPGKRTIALSGLLRQELGEDKSGLPFLTGIPILGTLFSSQKFQNHKTELVIFVTPEIHIPNGDEKIELPEGWVHDGI